MNDSHPHTIQYQGKTYCYDSDRDCFYPVPQTLTLWDRYGWLAVVAVLAAIALFFEFVPIR